MNKFLSILLPESKNRIEGLDLMRSLAILLVLFYHAWIFLSPFFQKLGMLFFMGFWGVELFFVLSGFLVGGIFIKKYINHQNDITHSFILSFWKKRWIRTIPIYLFALLLNYIVLTRVLYVEVDFPFRYFLFLQNFDSVHPAFFPEAWSLAIEEWFYILLPVFFLYKNVNKNFSAILYTIILMIAVYTLVRYLNTDLNSFNIVDWDKNVRKVVINRLDSILYGVLMFVFIYFKSDLIKSNRYKLFVLGVVGVILSYLFFYLKTSVVFNQVFFLSTTSLSFSLLIPFFYYFKFNSNSIKNISLYISTISYSLYLIHYTLIFRLMNNYFVGDTLFKAIIITISYIIISISFSTFIYYFVEKRFIDLKNKLE
jgi:peptidoglycan/LPS O-acetylase OafA/YrhL